MSDFAKSQLLKYGWTEGKGLGKNETGIIEALKPKLKFDTCGIGYKDIDFQWWKSIYNKALENIILDKKSNDVLINIKKKDAFNISSNTLDLEVSKKKHLLYYQKFLKTSILQDGNMIRATASELYKDDSKDNPIIITLSDEDLFKACDGRTIHKAARHGLTLNGKLSRIANQEKQLLATTFLKSNNEDIHVHEVKQKNKKFVKIENDMLEFKNEQILDGNDILILPSHIHTDSNYNISKKTRKKVKRKIHNLTHQLDKSCIIQDDLIKNKEISNENKTKYLKEISAQKTIKAKCTNKQKSKRKRDQTLINSLIKNPEFHNDICMEPRVKISKKNCILSESIYVLQTNNQSLNCIQNTNNLKLVKNKNKCKKDKNHHSSITHQLRYCTNTEAQRLNSKIKSKKMRKLKNEEKKKLKKLSESLLAVSLNINSREKNINQLSSNEEVCKRKNITK